MTPERIRKFADTGGMSEPQISYFEMHEMAAKEIERLLAALKEISDLTPEMIDVLPLDRAFRSLRDATKIARSALR